MESNISPSFGPEYQRLGKKTFILFVLDRLKVAAITIGLAIILFILAGQDSLRTAVTFTNLQQDAKVLGWFAILVFIVAFLIDLLDSWLLYLSYQFSVQDNAFMVKSGTFAKKEIAIPYRQIQDITIEQNIAHRALNMSRLVILTAGHEDQTEKKQNESAGILPAIDTHLAEMLRAELLKRTSVEKVTEIAS